MKSGSMNLGHFAFQIRQSTDFLKQKIESFDLHSDTLCYGDNKGNISLCRMQISDKDFKLEALANSSISKKPIDQIEFLRTSKHIAVLSNDVLTIIDWSTLAVKRVIGKSVNTFAVNPLNEWIAVASGKKIQIFSFKPDLNDFAPLVLGKSQEISMPDPISKLVWNGEILGAALKKFYVIVGPQSGKITEICNFKDTLFPSIHVFKDNWLMIIGDNIMMFDKSGAKIPNSEMNIQAMQKSHLIISISIQKHYLLILRSNMINVYNLKDYTKIQDIDLEKNDTGKVFVSDEEKVIIAMDTIPAPKKDPLGRFTFLKPVPVEIQIKQLLANGKVSEAQKVFSHNISAMDPQFEIKREEFNVEAGWCLIQNLEFEKAFGFFASVNYDPKEFLALIPELLSKDISYQTIKSLMDTKGIQSDKKELIMQDCIKTVIRLVEEKRKYLVEKYDLSKDLKKQLNFVYASAPLNESFKVSEKPTLEDLLELIDNSLLKLYLEQKDLKIIQAFFEQAKPLKCNYKLMDAHLNSLKDTDSTGISQVCLAFLYEKFENYSASMQIWKTIGSLKANEIRELACKEIAKLLIAHPGDQKTFFDNAKIIFLYFPEEGLKIFTENPSLPKFITEDDIIAFFDTLENFQAQLKEKYMEFLVSKQGTEERFHTLLGMHYINIIQAALAKEDKKTIEVTTDPTVEAYRGKLSNLLKTSKNYNVSKILGAIRGMGMFEEEILLYSKQKMHNEALSSLVELGKQSIDFTKAEQYCLDQAEGLLDVLFGKLMEMYKDAKMRYSIMEKDKAMISSVAKIKNELDTQKQYVINFEQYCKNYLKKYAGNEKLRAENVLNMLPEEWGLIDQIDSFEDSSLLQYLELTFNDRLEKANDFKVARGVAETHKLNVEADLLKLQRAHVLMNPERKCKVCLKPISGAKSFYVFPNGIVTHANCVKVTNICPVTNINFLKKIYE